MKSFDDFMEYVEITKKIYCWSMETFEKIFGKIEPCNLSEHLWNKYQKFSDNPFKFLSELDTNNMNKIFDFYFKNER